MRDRARAAGSGHETLCPYQAFDAADAPIILGVANDGFWHAVCALAGKPALGDDPRFTTNGDRVADRDVAVPIVANILARRSRAARLADFAMSGIPSSPVHTLGELSAHPQTEASGWCCTMVTSRRSPRRFVWTANASRYGCGRLRWASIAGLCWPSSVMNQKRSMR